MASLASLAWAVCREKKAVSPCLDLPGFACVCLVLNHHDAHRPYAAMHLFKCSYHLFRLASLDGRVDIFAQYDSFVRVMSPNSHERSNNTCIMTINSTVAGKMAMNARDDPFEHLARQTASIPV